MIDLTTLEGADTQGKVRSLCAKATLPDPTDPTTPRVAAVCVYSDLVRIAADALRRHRYPRRGRRDGVPLRTGAVCAVKLADTRDAVAAGADEIDMVIDRGAFLSGRYLHGLRRDRRGQGGLSRRRPDAHLKVILETGELVTYDNVRRASWLAMLAGGDFIKTSTGKIAARPRRCR